MTGNDEQQFKLFEDKLQQLIALCDGLKAENLELHDRLSALSRDLEESRTAYASLQSSYQHLKSGRVLEGVAAEDVGDTRKRLHLLVREVDHCIHMLNAGNIETSAY